MQIANYLDAQQQPHCGLIDGEALVPLAQSLTEILEAAVPAATVRSLQNAATVSLPLANATLLAPIDRQEVWAAGVTYKRSKTARMEESESAATLYDKVYVSPRPELFFKATPHRVAGTGQPLRIRRDSKWNVPEPELALVLSSRLKLVGFTIGNDMSSRDIEGENPLYLPQAKCYDQCCGLGPWITLAAVVPDATQLGIHLEVRRAGSIAFQGDTRVSQMARSFDDLIDWLGRDNSFPHGVILLTGTGIVPNSDFTLQAGDEVQIAIEGLGELVNPIVQG